MVRFRARVGNATNSFPNEQTVNEQIVDEPDDDSIMHDTVVLVGQQRSLDRSHPFETR